MVARSRRASGRVGGATTPSGIFGLLGTGGGRLALVGQAGGLVPFHERWPPGLVDFHERWPFGLADQVEGSVASPAAPSRIFGPLGTGDGRLALVGQAGGLVPFHERWPLGLVDFHERWPLGLVDQVEGLVAPPPPAEYLVSSARAMAAWLS